jgi:DNA polymerase sigma
MGQLPRGNPRCKYETAPQLGKRRIQYDIGDEILPRPQEDPKKYLDPDEEKKLQGDMRELYDRLLPTPESEDRRMKLVGKLDRILRKEWPGNEFTVHVFGSSENMLCTSESDGSLRHLQGGMFAVETDARL